MSRKLGTPLILLPFAFATYAVEFYLSHNISILALTWTQLYVVLQLLFFVLLGTAVCFLVFFLVCRRDVARASLCTVTVVMLSTFFGVLREYLSFGMSYRYFFLVWAFLLVGSLLLLARARWPSRSTLSPLWAAGIVLLILPIPAVVVDVKPRLESRQPPLDLPRLAVPASAPDVYYLILDSYLNAESLARFHDYDNGPFLDRLRELGFHVVPEALANYPFTMASTSSAFDMAYLEDGRNLIDVQADNSLIRTFKEAHYRTFAFRGLDVSGLLGHLPEVDALIDCPSLDRVQLSFIQLLPMGQPLVRRALPSLKKQNADCIFSKLQTFAAAETPQPRFVIAYFYPIHEEFAIGASGELYSHAYRMQKYQTKAGLSELYLEELAYINTKLIETLSHIITVSPHAPVIVLQGDHGTRIMNFTEDEDFIRPTRSQFLERWGILNAIRVDPPIRHLIPDDLTPVNTFRFLFKTVYASDIELLENRFFNAEDDPIDALGR